MLFYTAERVNSAVLICRKGEWHCSTLQKREQKTAEGVNSAVLHCSEAEQCCFTLLRRWMMLFYTAKSVNGYRTVLSVFFFFFLSTSLSPAGNSGHLTWLSHSCCKSSAADSYQSVQSVHVTKQWLLWLPVFGIFNVCTDVNACDCTWRLYGHCKRVCTESWLWEKNPLPYQGLEPVSVLHLGFSVGCSTNLAVTAPCAHAI